MVTFEFETIHEKIVAHDAGCGQTHRLRGTYRMEDGRKVRVLIKYDSSYQFQSNAKCELWDGERWNNVVSFVGDEVGKLCGAWEGMGRGAMKRNVEYGLKVRRDEMLEIAHKVMCT